MTKHDKIAHTCMSLMGLSLFGAFVVASAKNEDLVAGSLLIFWVIFLCLFALWDYSRPD